MNLRVMRAIYGHPQITIIWVQGNSQYRGFYSRGFMVNYIIQSDSYIFPIIMNLLKF